MAKMTFDTTGVDASSTTGFPPYEGEVPRPGTYYAEIRSCRIAVGKSSGNPYIKVLYVLAGDDKNPKKNAFKGAPIFDNVVPGDHEIQQTRLAQFLKAVSGKQKAVIDHDEVEDGGKVNKVGGKEPVGTKVKIVVQADSYNGERTARVSDVFPLAKGEKFPTGVDPVEDEDEVAEEDETEEVETEEVEEDEDAEEDDEDESSEEEEDEAEEEAEDGAYEERVAELAALNRTELKAALKAANPDFKVLKKHTDDDLREAVLAAEFEAEEDEGGDSEPPF